MKKLLSTFAVWIALLAPALAANVNIDALPAAGSVAGTDLLECEQTGTNRKCTAAQTAAYVYGLMSGDATAAGGGAVTFATVNANVGSFGSASNCVSLTVNAKGLITAASQTACAPTGGAIQPVSGTSSTVPGMTAGSAVADTDVFYASQSSGTNDRKVTGAQVKTYANTSAVRATTTTTEALANSDQNKLVTFSNAAAVACTIAQAGSGGNFAAGWAVSLKNLGAGTVTCTPTTSTVDGAANFTLTTGQGVDLYSDGTNYFTQPGKGGSGTVTTTGSPANGNLTKFSGASSITSGDLSGDVSTNGTLTTTLQGPFPPYTASSWYLAPQSGSYSNGSTFTASQIYCRLFLFPRTVTIGTVGLNVVTGGGGNIQVAYYTNNASNLPGTLLQSTGSISTATNGNKSGALGANIQIGPGGSSTGRDVWICVNSDNNTHSMVAYNTGNSAPVTMGATSQTNLMPNAGATTIDNISCNGANCNGGSSTYNTWPASLTGSTWTFNLTTSRFPVPQFQVVSSP